MRSVLEFAVEVALAPLVIAAWMAACLIVLIGFIVQAITRGMFAGLA